MPNQDNHDARIDHDEQNFVVEFLLSGKSPGDLLASRKADKALLVKEYIHTGPPESMKFADPVKFARLQDAVKRLQLSGW